ncbi:LOW QUALITY PROTEIN: putative polyketide synthase [Neurospora tetraspora]|uniref:Polyketide synthase n=1 Tax=Neurospora tetraspora TaxID=94610 RepID=A0AAE0JGS7_9PEZI|nr:LOW QUALITY PROTEIN: putative polyketide synthase [Neurospora tetraspora]
MTNGSNGASSFDKSRHHGHEERTMSHPQSASPIAVVGMACRFPGGVTSPEGLWDLCASGRDAWSPIPESRFDVKSYYDPNPAKSGRNHATGGYFLHEDVALFDAAFFRFTSEVASAADPQLRLLLEVTYEATEDAKLAGPGPNTSVFVGCYTKDYHDVQTRDPETMPPSTLTGNYTAMFSNRVSHFYDFQGASMSIDTGCSAALAALHQACQTIRSGESHVSIVGASNAILNPDIYIAMSTLGMVGADGRCYAWDSRAQGYGRGEGVAVLSLDAAVRDGDRVHATGLNQDGRTTSITSPSMDAQIRLIRHCYQRADTGYVEAHMTGTQAGDVTEAESLARTFGASRTQDDPVWVGSVKTNVGHTEGVSGLAGIIKTAMAMKYRAIPPNQNYVVGNDKIPLDDWHLRVPTNVVPWPRNKPLRASISNFGYGGTNAHVILEGAPETRLANGNGRRTTTADDAMAGNLAACIRKSIEGEMDLQPADIAFTLSHRRSRLSYITTVRASNLAELADDLDKTAALKVGHAPANKRAPRLGFVFNGQGAQWHAMGRELLYAYPVFAEAIDEADRVLREMYGADWSLREELTRDAKSSRVSEIHLGQPITVALQVCLVVLLRSWGIRPSAVTSHSSGEIAAAYAAGALSFEQTLGVTYWRGELARTLLDPKASGVVGGMAAAGVGPDEAERYVRETTSDGRVVVACVNSPESVTLSGDIDDLDEVVRRLEADGKFARKLRVALAYHSPHMRRMESAYLEKLRDIVPSSPTWPGDVRYTSPVTGGVVTSAQSLSAEHYVRNLTSPVLFSQAFEAMCFGETDASSAQVDAIVEIGPHGALAGPMRQILRGRKMAYMSCLQRNANAVETMQDVAGELVRLGYAVSLSAINKYPEANGEEAVTTSNIMKFVPGLPTYPWNHSSRYWIESRVNKDIRHKRFPPHELLGMPVSGATTPAWRNFIRLVDLPWIGDHRVDGMVVLPGAAYVSMAIEAVRLVTDPSEDKIRGYRVKNVEFLSALVVPESEKSVGGVEMYFRLGPSRREGDKADGWYEYEVRSLGANDMWVENCGGLVSAVVEQQDIEDAVAPNVDSFLKTQESKVRRVAGSALRADVASMGVQYGPAFQGIADVVASKTLKRAAADLDILELESPSASPYFASYVIHPTTLDCIIQATYANLPPDTGKTSMVLPRSLQDAFVPRSLNRGGRERLAVFSELRSAQRRGFTSDVSVANSQQQGDSRRETPLVINQLFCQAIPRDEAESGLERIPLYESRWVPIVSRGGIPSSIKEYMRTTLAGEELDYEKKVVRASYHLIADAAAELEGQPSGSWTAHGHASFAWMQSVLARGKSGQLMPGSKAWGRASKGLKQKLFDELRSTGGTHGGLLVRIGQKLAQIVRGEVTPAALLGEDNDDLMRQYNSGLPSLQTRSYKQLARIANVLALQQPGAAVLEVGAGNGAAAGALLEAFGQGGNGGLLIDRYIFSDASSVHFEAAKQKLARWTKVLEFRELDLGKEGPTETSHDVAAERSIDLVVASMNLHAVNNPKTALENMRKLLKPGGKLLLVVKTHVSLDAQLICSTLPGWEQQGEQPEFVMVLEAWDEALRANGFTGVEFDIADCEQPQFQRWTVMLTSVAPEQEASAVNPSSPSNPSLVTIVHAESTLSPSQQKWLSQLGEAIYMTTGIRVTLESLEEVQPGESQVHILAADVAKNGCVLDDMDESMFHKLRRVLLESRGVLWLSNGAGPDASATPASSQVQGLLRTLRHENVDRSYVLLDLPTTWAEEADVVIKHVVGVLQQTLLNKEFGHADADWEYAIQDSVVHVPRIFPAMGSKEESKTKTFQPFQDPHRPLVWEEALDSGEGGFWCGAANELADGVVEIETRAFSLDPRVHHHRTATEADDEEATAVHEVAGIVTRLGHNTDASGFQLGDKVCGVTKGPYASIAQASWTSVAKIPDGLSFEEAVCAPLAYSGAYYALVHVARLRRGDKVLIVQADGGADGTAGLAVANHVGADVWFATTDLTEAETHRLMDTYHLAPSQILKSRYARELGDAIKGQTGGQGVDVVLTGPTSLLSAPLLQSALNSIANFGRFVEIGGWNKSLDVAQLAARCATYARVDMIQLSDHNGLLMKESLDAGLGIIFHNAVSSSSGSSSPLTPVTRFSPSQMSQAVRHLEQQRQRRKAGKVVIAAQDDSPVQVMSPVRRPLRLDDKRATYLIVGGVDGIGGAIASWMVSKGARSVVLISRNAETHPQAEGLVEDAALRGCRLQVLNCDVSSEESLVRLLRQVSATSPPVRGVIHAANVLADTVFDRMSFAQWRKTVGPKVAGTRNLHKHLPQDLSFFVLLSSVIGVMGHVSQANYAAANAFEDALASHRVALGLPAVSLALPAVLGVGMVASDEDARHRVEALGTESIHVDAVFRLIEDAIQHDTRLQHSQRSSRFDQSPGEARRIVGLLPWSSLTPEAGIRRDRRFGTLRLVQTASSSQSTQTSEATSLDPTAILVRALGHSSIDRGEKSMQEVKGTAQVAEALAARLAAIFNVDVASVDPEQGVSVLGVDSLVAVELRNWLALAGQAKLSIFEVLQSASLNQVAELIIRRSALVK